MGIRDGRDENGSAQGRSGSGGDAGGGGRVRSGRGGRGGRAGWTLPRPPAGTHVAVQPDAVADTYVGAVDDVEPVAVLPDRREPPTAAVIVADDAAPAAPAVHSAGLEEPVVDEELEQLVLVQQVDALLLLPDSSRPGGGRGTGPGDQVGARGARSGARGVRCRFWVPFASSRFLPSRRPPRCSQNGPTRTTLLPRSSSPTI